MVSSNKNKTSDDDNTDSNVNDSNSSSCSISEFFDTSIVSSRNMRLNTKKKKNTFRLYFPLLDGEN